MRTMLRGLDRALTPLSFVGELAVALMCIHIVVEIVATNFFRSPIEGTTEVVARWYMVALVFLPLASIQRRNGHIKVEVFTNRLSTRTRATLDSLAHLLMAALASFFTWYSSLDAMEAFRREEAIELMRGVIPVWPTRWFVPVGFAAMGLVALLMSIRLAFEPQAVDEAQSQ